MNEHGFLFTGKAESPLALGDLFRIDSVPHHLYRPLDGLRAYALAQVTRSARRRAWR